MTDAPFDPDETHDAVPDPDPFDDNSLTWGSVDPDFDELFRERLGPLPLMPTPPYAFERVLVAGRRRRARKVWTGAAAAAFVVMVGTAGTTVALHGGSSGPTIGAAQPGQSTSAAAAKSPSASAPPSTSASPTATAGSTSSAGAATASACASSVGSSKG